MKDQLNLRVLIPQIEVFGVEKWQKNGSSLNIIQIESLWIG